LETAVEAPRRGANVALRFGSAEALRAIRDSRDHKDETPKKQLKEAVELNELTRGVIRALESRRPAPVAPWS
jgi:hypothetical protein